ncbi:MAG: alkaline phosphatase family protein [Oscillospiraceae bacterium]|nr:alkaline phosphatase family protein [Oscillospiraceae bacterium]
MFRTIFGFFQSIILVITLFTTSGQFLPSEFGCYLRRLDRMGIYNNSTRDSVPQTEFYDLILDHFSQERDDGRTPKAIMIVYDGARADALVNTVDSSESAIFQLQREGGHIYHMHTGGPNLRNQQGVDTAQGFATMLTGRWAFGDDGHGVFSNSHTKPADGPPLIFQPLLEGGYVDSAAFIVSWNGHFTRTNADGVGTANYSNDVALFQQLGLTDADDPAQGAMRWSMNPNDAATTASTIEMLEDPDGPGFLVISLEYTDSAGHRYTFGNHRPEYVQAFHNAERAGLDMIEAIRARPTYEQEDWLIMITSDHGGFSHYHGRQFQVTRQVFLAVNRNLPGWGACDAPSVITWPNVLTVGGIVVLAAINVFAIFRFGRILFAA